MAQALYRFTVCRTQLGVVQVYNVTYWVVRLRCIVFLLVGSGALTLTKQPGCAGV